MRIAISDEKFDELAELACRIEDDDVPICEYLRCTEWFELLVAYGRANRERGDLQMNRKYAKDAFNEYQKNLIENHHVSEEELADFDQFMGILRGDIPTPVVCGMDLEIRERKRIFEQFVRGLKEN